MRLCVYFSPSNPLPQQTQKKYYVNYITASSYVTMRLFLNTPQRTEPCPMSTKKTSASSYVTMCLIFPPPQRTEPCPMSTKSMPPAMWL